jgi:hypothetical protein
MSFLRFAACSTTKAGSDQVAGRSLLKTQIFQYWLETISYSEPVAIKFGVRRPAANSPWRGKWPFPKAVMLVTLPSGSIGLH